jgi:hypothetical protein
MDPFELEKISDLFADTAEHIPDCEDLVNTEPKCTTCGSTNLIKISDYSKAMLFLRNSGDTLEPNKIDSHVSGKRNKFTTLWWCLNCKRLC